jgi:hypothetical protein
MVELRRITISKMASRKTYTCFVCQKAGHDIQVFLDGKDEAGHTKYLNEDMTRHTHLGSSLQQEQQLQSQQSQGSTTVVTEPTAMKIINAKLDRIISLLESQKKQE